MARSLNLQAYSYSYTDISQYVKERDRAKGIVFASLLLYFFYRNLCSSILFYDALSRIKTD